jgi:hypothetical protein
MGAKIETNPGIMRRHQDMRTREMEVVDNWGKIEGNQARAVG